MQTTPSSTLKVGDLQLRPIRDADAAPLHGILSDPRVYGPTSYDVLSLDETRSLITDWLANEEAGRARFWAVTQAEDDLLIGRCGSHRIDPKHKVAELGYEIAPASWHRGIATAAVGAVVAWTFSATAIRRIEAVAWIDNVASIRVLEKGSFRREGYLREYRLSRGQPRDFYMYSLLRTDAVHGPAQPPHQATGGNRGG